MGVLVLVLELAILAIMAVGSVLLYRRFGLKWWMVLIIVAAIVLFVFSFFRKGSDDEDDLPAVYVAESLLPS